MLPLYERIESLCSEKSINITMMCKEAEVPRSALSDYKAGRKKTISITNLEKIANYFDVSVDYLLGKTEQKKPLVNDDEELTEYLEVLRTRPEMKMMFNLTKKATKSDVEKFVKLIEALMENE